MEHIHTELMFTIGNKKYYSSGENMLVQFPRSTPFSVVLNEAESQAVAFECGLPVSEIIEVTNIDGDITVVSPLIKGRLLSDIVRCDGWSDELLSKFVMLQIEVHSKKSPVLHKLRDKMHRWISESPLNPTVRYDLHTKLDTLPKHNKICHGNYLPDRIIVTESGELFIMDWSETMQGNASADALFTYFTLYLDYGTVIAEKYISLFCNKSDISREYTEKWEPIVSSVMMRCRDTDAVELLKKRIIKK